PWRNPPASPRMAADQESKSLDAARCPPDSLASFRRASWSGSRSLRRTTTMRFGRVVFFAAALTSVLCTGAAWAQTGTVSGTVTDSTGAPVSGADVRVDGTTIHVLTDDRGHFELTGVPGR